MNLVTFLSEIFLPNIELYIVCSLLVFLLLLPIHRRFVKGVTDPFFYQLWMNGLAYVVPVFLYFTDTISYIHFYYFIISETFFWIGFYLFSKCRNSFSQVEIIKDNRYSSVLFVFAVTIYLFSLLFVYLYFGIPLFYSNRNDVFANADGLGVLSRLSPFASIYILIYSYHQFLDNKKKIYKWFIFLVAINSILSGGKSTILSLVFAYFYYSYFCRGRIPKLKKKYMLLLALFPIIILLASSASSNFGASIIDLSQRFIANGDIYWCAYPNDVIDQIKISNPISHLFISFLGPMRLVSYAEYEIVEPIGLLLNWEVNPSLKQLGITNAPNSRLAVVGWVYFKWYGIFFSFILGCFSSYIIHHLKKYFPQSILGVAFYSSLYFAALSCAADPGLAISLFFDCFLNLCLYTFVLFLVSGFRITYRLSYK